MEIASFSEEGVPRAVLQKRVTCDTVQQNISGGTRAKQVACSLAAMICPKCKEDKAHRSRRAGFKDWVARVFLYVPYRCRACGTRSYIFPHGSASMRLRTPEELRVIKLRRSLRTKKLKRELIGYGISSIILVLILYYFFQQRIPSE